MLTRRTAEHTEESWFWDCVNKTDDCWNWTRGTRRGYGRFSQNINGKKKLITAHRYSWEKINGAIPIGLILCHKCDNRKCVRPSHLFLGTELDNARDRNSKNRHAFGERNHSKLTEEQVLKIKAEYIPGIISFKNLSEKYGVSDVTCRKIYNGQKWSYLK